MYITRSSGLWKRCSGPFHHISQTFVGREKRAWKQFRAMQCYFAYRFFWWPNGMLFICSSHLCRIYFAELCRWLRGQTRGKSVAMPMHVRVCIPRTCSIAYYRFNKCCRDRRNRARMLCHDVCAQQNWKKSVYPGKQDSMHLSIWSSLIFNFAQWNSVFSKGKHVRNNKC